MEVFYLDGRPSVVFPRTNYFKWGPWQAFVQDGASQVELENSKDSSKKFNFALEHGELTLEEDNFIEADDQYLYFRGNERSPQQGLIYRLKLESGSSPELIISEEAWASISSLDRGPGLLSALFELRNEFLSHF